MARAFHEERTEDRSALEVLDRGPSRTLLLERDQGRVIKRFHHPRRLEALFDGRRARREAALLAHLRASGLPVPELYDCRRGKEGAWEVHMQWVRNARSLASFLAPVLGASAELKATVAASVNRPTPPPGGWRCLLRRLGALLARLERAGVRHDDLHPGNVLVAPDGAPWLIDFHQARRVRALRGARQRRSQPQHARATLVRCAAAAREVLPAGLRAWFLVGWHHALEEPQRRLVAPPAALGEWARGIEREARAARRASVLANLERWMRPSSRLRGHGNRLLRRGVDTEALETFVRDAREDQTLPDTHGCTISVLEARGSSTLGTFGPLLALHGPPDELRRRWRNAARMMEHRLPCWRPLAFTAHHHALFDRPAPESKERFEGVPTDRAQRLAHLLGLLHDRGLDPGRLTGNEQPPMDDLLLPPRTLEPFDPLPDREPPGRRLRLLAEHAPGAETTRAARAAYLAAFAGWPEEQRLLATRL